MEAFLRLEHELLAVESEHRVHAMLELTAPPAPSDRPRPPLRLALVIDRSGSMAGPKLETTKECASFLVRRMAPTDELALVTYDDEVQLLAPLMPVQQGALLAAVGSIFPGGSTNLSGGWLKGMEVLQQAPSDGARKVLLLTDGLANVGIVDRPSLVSMTAEAAGTGVGTTTIGFGDGFDEELLTAMADSGHGNAYYAETPDAAPGIFAQEFEGLLSLVAQNVSVEIRPSDRVQVLSVLNEYPQVAVPNGVQLQMGDAYAEERRRVVFELFIPELAILGIAKVADVVIRYVSVGERVEMHEVTAPLTVNLVSADEAAAAGPDREVVEEVLVLKSARAQDEARKLADEGEFDKARAVLQNSAEQLRRVAPNSRRSEELVAQAKELDEHASMMRAEMYGPSTSKTLHFNSQQIRRKRPTGKPKGENDRSPSRPTGGSA
jgi:Ca-activated chloride channel family protein